jgi:hypothetical protein
MAASKCGSGCGAAPPPHSRRERLGGFARRVRRRAYPSNRAFCRETPNGGCRQNRRGCPPAAAAPSSPASARRAPPVRRSRAVAARRGACSIAAFYLAQTGRRRTSSSAPRARCKRRRVAAATGFASNLAPHNGISGKSGGGCPIGDHPKW